MDANTHDLESIAGEIADLQRFKAPLDKGPDGPIRHSRRHAYNEDSVAIPKFDVACVPECLIRILQNSYGVHAFRTVANHFGHGSSSRMQYSRYASRACPSGGAAYPCELFVAKVSSTVAHVELLYFSTLHDTLIGTNVWITPNRIKQLLPLRQFSLKPDFVVFVCVASMRTIAKYGEFAFRLIPQDVGVLIGQMGISAAAEATTMHSLLLFDDRAAARTLQLDDLLEPVFAIVELKCRSSNEVSCDARRQPVAWSHGMSRDIPDALARALRESQSQICPTHSRLPRPSSMSTAKLVSLTEDSSASERVDMNAYFKLRFSAGQSFDGATLPLRSLSTILLRSLNLPGMDVDRYTTDHDFFLYVAAWGISDLREGIYRYIPSSHSLEVVCEGDVLSTVQKACYLRNIAFESGGCSIVIAGNEDSDIDRFGRRGYRLQQIHAGMLAQRIGFFASQTQLGSHIVLGFDVPRINSLCDLDRLHKTALVQIVVGSTRMPTELVMSRRASHRAGY